MFQHYGPAMTAVLGHNAETCQLNFGSRQKCSKSTT